MQISKSKDEVVFSSSNFAETEALRAIFEHEGVLFETGAGTDGQCTIVFPQSTRVAMSYLLQWRYATDWLDRADLTYEVPNANGGEGN